jgi:glycerophosphoryl diester phosphodiesterase
MLKQCRGNTIQKSARKLAFFHRSLERFGGSGYSTGVSTSAQELLERPGCVVIGHRGYAARAPENTLPSFRLSLAAEADLIELDYHHSKDGVPIVIHDATLDRTTNARKLWKRRRIRVADKTAAEIQILDAGSWFDRKFAEARIPLLSEALGFISDNGGVPLIEHKSGDAAELVKLLRAKKLINRAVVISFDWSFLRDLHELEPKQILGALGPPTHLLSGRRRQGNSKKLTRSWLTQIEKTGAALVVWNRHVTQKNVTDIHQRKLKIWIYTVDQAQVARRLIALGCDGIITNQIDRCKTALREYQPSGKL